MGIASGYRVSEIVGLETLKLLNVTGLFYDLLGVVVLTEFVSSNPKLKKVSVELVAPGALWLQSVSLFGVMLGGLTALVTHGRSSASVSKFAFLFWGDSVLPLAMLEMLVVFPRFAVLKGIESRWRWFGFFLSTNGVTLQLIAVLCTLGR